MNKPPHEPFTADFVVLPVSRAARLRRERRLSGLRQNLLFEVQVLMAAVAVFAGLALQGPGTAPVELIAWAVAAGSLAGVAAILGRAAQHRKLIAYWNDRLQLRVDLRRSRAHARMLALTLARLSSAPTDAPVSDMRMLLESLSEALAARHDDLAAVIVAETDNRFVVMEVVAVRGRLHSVAAGTSCSGHETTFEQVLLRYAPYVRQAEVETGVEMLRLGVLSLAPFDSEDEELLGQAYVCVRLLSDRWDKTAPSPRTLRAVS